MGSRSEHYLARAAECERMAAAAKDPDIKHRFLEIARYWRELANNAVYLDSRSGE
jgi:hypothetical protein